MADDRSIPVTAHVRRRFDRAASGFDAADFVHEVTRNGLFDRLRPIATEARVVVDLGAATGKALKPLARRFRGARIVAVDLSRRMLERCVDRRPWLSKIDVVQADAGALPFGDQTVDVVFANQLLPWVAAKPVFAEVRRILRREGLFAFSTLGPDTLAAVEEAWAGADEHFHVNRFPDMHDIGDALVGAGLRDPVLDVDRLSVRYKSAADLFRDLTAAGARNALAGRRRTLTGKGRFAAMRRRLETAAAGEGLGIDLEIVYGHCFGSGRREEDGEVRIDPGSIGRRMR